MDKGWQGGLEFGKGGILFHARSGGDEGTQFSNALFGRGGHNQPRLAEIAGLRSTALPVCVGGMPTEFYLELSFRRRLQRSRFGVSNGNDFFIQ